MTKPQEGNGKPNKFNADLWSAVLGGGAGSFGILVEIVLDTINDDDYYTIFWEVNFLYDDSNLPGIIQMLRKFAEVVSDDDVLDDPRWNVFWTLIGSKRLLRENSRVGFLFSPDFPVPDIGLFGKEFNYFQIDFLWAVPRKYSGLQRR